MPLLFAIVLQACSHCIPQFTKSKSSSTGDSQEQIFFSFPPLFFLFFFFFFSHSSLDICFSYGEKKKKLILLEITFSGFSKCYTPADLSEPGLGVYF